MNCGSATSVPAHAKHCLALMCAQALELTMSLPGSLRSKFRQRLWAGVSRSMLNTNKNLRVNVQILVSSQTLSH